VSAPTVDRQAILSIPGVEELPARVASVREEYTDLALLRPPRSALMQLERAQAYLDFMTDEGVYRTIGTVRIIPDSAEHLLRFEPRGRVQLLQRRAFVRTDCIAPVLLKPHREGAKPLKGITLNLSGGGLLVRGLQNLDVGAHADFDLRLDLLPARVQGVLEIVRFTPEGFAGVQFTEIDDADRDKLVRFAYTRERAALEQRRRG
jgi:PilZ domain